MSILSTALSDIGVGTGTQRLLTGSTLEPASTTTVEVQGLAELEQKLDALPDKLAKTSLVAAVRAAATVFQNYAKATAPYDPEAKLGHPAWRTLHLRDGITLRMSTKKFANGGEVTGSVGPDAKHAFFGRFVEFGHITAGGGQVAPHPFMRPTFESQQEAALEAFLQTLTERIAADLLRG